MHSDPKLRIPFGNSQRKTQDSFWILYGLVDVSNLYDLLFQSQFQSYKKMWKNGFGLRDLYPVIKGQVLVTDNKKLIGRSKLKFSKKYCVLKLSGSVCN